MELKDLEARKVELEGFIKINDERSLKLQEMAKQVNDEFAQLRNYSIANYATLTEINKWIEAIKKKEAIADINKDYIPNEKPVDIKSKKK